MSPALLRLLDANANRAREGLRVIEDYARFVLDDGPLQAELKAIRHDLTAALTPYLADAILWRDTPGDVGTANKTPAEGHRKSFEDLVVAAGKRMGEALRAIEEAVKTSGSGFRGPGSGAEKSSRTPEPGARNPIESIRYRFYDLEQRIAFTLRPAKRFANVRLYVLITESVCSCDWFTAAERAIDGGADCLQLREKDLHSGELLRRAKRLVELCKAKRVLCVINDRPDIALLSGADGVHVGQGDLPARDVRKLIGSQMILGVSTHEIAHAKQAVLDGADYLGVGPIFKSGTKPREFVSGLDYAKEVASQIQIPAVAIAGITADNLDQVIATGVKAIAVTAAVVGASDITAAARELKARLLSFGRTDIPVCCLGLLPSPASEPRLKINRRHLPHWQLTGSTYFLTFRLIGGQLNATERAIVLNHIRGGDGQFYRLYAVMVMPDHVHVLFLPNTGFTLSRIEKGMKGASARLLNQHRNTSGYVWQNESFDRIMRDQDELQEKLNYMLNNSVKAGLVQDPWEYDGWWVSQSME